MTAIDELGRRVVDAIGMPKDAWEIAAQLEVTGLRDGDAHAYGVADLFELARVIERRFHEGTYGFHFGEDERPRRVLPVLRFVGGYFAGIAFALPMAMQAVSMLLWRYGIWGAIDLDLAQGSAIALGFILSYIVAGGFAQAIVRRGLFYLFQEEEELARWTAWRGFRIAVRASIALLVAGLAANVLFRALPWRIAGIAAAFYAGLTILWLSWALLYLARRTELLVVVTAISLACVIGAAHAGAAPIVANAIGVAVADACSLAFAAWLLRRIARKRGTRGVVNPPRLGVLAFSTTRYVVYGLLFNTFLFADRIVAWTTSVGRDDFPPYAFWLNVRYELAMDLALVVVIVMGGMVHYAIQRFSDKLVAHEKRTSIEVRRTFAEEQSGARRRRSVQLALTAAIALALTALLFRALQRVGDAALQQSLGSQVTMRVLVVAAIAYVIFMFAVRDLLLLLTLSRVDQAVRVVAISLGVNLLVGFVGSRAIGHWVAVAGLLAGSIVMCALAAKEARRAIGDLDYTYYSAY